jgi:hypothetical protein
MHRFIIREEINTIVSLLLLFKKYQESSRIELDRENHYGDVEKSWRKAYYMLILRLGFTTRSL